MFCVLDRSSNILPLIVNMPDVFIRKDKAKKAKAKKMRGTRKPWTANFLLHSLPYSLGRESTSHSGLEQKALANIVLYFG